MYFIDGNKLDIRLSTDASDFGIGGVLFQVVGAIWQPIAFISKSLTPTQIRWSTIQKEAYAIFYCCTQLDYLIRDRTFTYAGCTSWSDEKRWFVPQESRRRRSSSWQESQSRIAEMAKRSRIGIGVSVKVLKRWIMSEIDRQRVHDELKRFKNQKQKQKTGLKNLWLWATCVRTCDIYIVETITPPLSRWNVKLWMSNK